MARRRIAAAPDRFVWNYDFRERCSLEQEPPGQNNADDNEDCDDDDLDEGHDSSSLAEASELR